MTVAFTDLGRKYALHQNEYEEAALEALRSGWYILGSALQTFEREFANYIGTDYCIGVGCGQDALTLAVRALGIGPDHEVIVAGNTYIATVFGITENGANPVFVDCNEYFQIDEKLIETAITPRTRAVLLTNLYGQSANLTAIRAICDSYNLALIEDCAQSHGSTFDGHMSGTMGDISCFSFYPTKPLGAFGDGGACVTDNDELANRLRLLRNYGSRVKYENEICGANSRLDEVQAALLSVGLRHIDGDTQLRLFVASRYLDEIKSNHVKLPQTHPKSTNVYHIFPLLVEERDSFIEHMNSRGIQTQVHYPIPPHRAKCFQGKGYSELHLPLTEQYASSIVSLPIYSGMPDCDVTAVIEAVNHY